MYQTNYCTRVDLFIYRSRIDCQHSPCVNTFVFNSEGNNDLITMILMGTDLQTACRRESDTFISHCKKKGSLTFMKISLFIRLVSHRPMKWDHLIHEYAWSANYLFILSSQCSILQYRQLLYDRFGQYIISCQQHLAKLDVKTSILQAPFQDSNPCPLVTFSHGTAVCLRLLLNSP